MHQRRLTVNTMVNGRLQSHQVVSRLHSIEGVSLLRPHYSMKKELTVYAQCWCRARRYCPLPQDRIFRVVVLCMVTVAGFQVNPCNDDQSCLLFDIRIRVRRVA